MLPAPPAFNTYTMPREIETLIGVVPPEQIFRADAIAHEIPGVSLVINALRPVLPVS